MAEVVIFNRNGPIPLRHIVTIHEPYDRAAFEAWYYGFYRKLDGDEFVYCPTREERDACIQALAQEG